MGEQGGRGRVDVHAHRIHAILDDCVQGAGQGGLVDIMLVLAHPDGLGFDLDEFRERILQAPGNRDRATQADIEAWKFLGRQL